MSLLARLLKEAMRKRHRASSGASAIAPARCFSVPAQNGVCGIVGFHLPRRRGRPERAALQKFACAH